MIMTTATTNTNSISWLEDCIIQRLQQRKQKGTIRQLPAAISTTIPVNTANSNSIRNDASSAATCTSSNRTTPMIRAVTTAIPSIAGTAAAATTTTTTTSSSRTAGRSRIDFASNDYLGLAHDIEQYNMVEYQMKQYIRKQQQDQQPILGSTGSRLLSGDHSIYHIVEQELCLIHASKMALLCNSGYDANVSVISTLPCTCLLYDSYIHNSIHMGIRLWNSNNDNDDKKHSTHDSIHPTKIYVPFQHNNVIDLQQKLEQYRALHHTIIIVVESIYSMDGDVAPVVEILNIAHAHQSLVVVDEAHGFGVYGKNQREEYCNGYGGGGGGGGTGILAMHACEQHPALFIAIYTYGKAAGCHGAVITSPYSHHLKDYLINYAYPIIYSTTLPLHSIITIRCSYATITGSKGQSLRQHLYELIQHFRTQMNQLLQHLHSVVTTNHPYRLIESTSPIQALIIPGNVQCTHFCNALYEKSHGTIRLFPIKTPTVPLGLERIRIVLHAHNTIEQVNILIQYIDETLQALVQRHEEPATVVEGTTTAELLYPTTLRLRSKM